MQLAVTLRSGAVLTGKGGDIRRLLAYTSAFGAQQAPVDVTLRVDGAAGPTVLPLTVRWLNPMEVVYIAEVPDA